MKLPITLGLVAALFLAQETSQRPSASPKVGAPAPVFRLNDQAGVAQTIGGESETWTVVAFYPKAMTPG